MLWKTKSIVSLCFVKLWNHLFVDEQTIERTFDKSLSNRLTDKTRTYCCPFSPSVWPDLVNFHHFGKYLKIFGNIFKVYLVLEKVLNSLWHNLYAIGKIFIAEKAKYWTHHFVNMVTLLSFLSFLSNRAFEKSLNFFAKNILEWSYLKPKNNLEKSPPVLPSLEIFDPLV